MRTKFAWMIVLAFTVSLLLPGGVRAGWGLPIWNPFASKSSSKPASRKVSGSISDDKSFSLARSRTSTPEPSTWDKISSGTSNTLKKTGSYLTPWKQEAPPPPKPSGSRGYRSSKAEPAASTTTWYNPTTWFGSSATEPAPKRTESVPSFLGQARPDY